MKLLRVAICQANFTVGDLSGNKRKIVSFFERAQKFKPDLVIFPELALLGYPPEDLVLKPHFRKACKKFLDEIVRESKGSSLVVVGCLEEEGGRVYNSAALIQRGKLLAFYRKMNLPNYGVFDEKRYFFPGKEALVLNLDGIRVGITICEDIWVEYGPHIVEALSGAELIINISASPYHREKIYQRMKLLEDISRRYGLRLVYVNLVGGQDELVFDGASMLVESGKVRAIARQFQEDILFYDFKFPKPKSVSLPKDVKEIKVGLKLTQPKPEIMDSSWTLLDPIEEIYTALLLGTRDYVKKNGFEKVVIGLSGGIDSSLTAVIAVDALGKENVIGVSMPSIYSSSSSLKDAEKLARNLGIRLLQLPIKEIYKKYLESLRSTFEKLPFDKTEENIQARIRGNLLMALSNKFGWLVLTTGNKSEVSTGYCTLYGDMAGGFAVIKDVLKTVVYSLASWRNQKAGTPIIPEEVFRKPPSAELRPGQKDSDALPEYDILDQIISLYIEEEMSLDEILKLGYRKGLVKKVIDMIDRNEYKRRQAPPGIKITPKAFGKDRRMPITNRYNPS